GLRMQWLVKRSSNLDGVKVLREIGRLVESLGAARWIDIAGPVRIRPSRRAHAQDLGCGRGMARPGTGGKMIFVCGRCSWCFASCHEVAQAIGCECRVVVREEKCQRGPMQTLRPPLPQELQAAMLSP